MNPMRKVIEGVARHVWQELGSGYVENVYRSAMAVGLSAQGYAVREEVTVPAMYQGRCVGHGRIDLTVQDHQGGVYVVELKQSPKLLPTHQAQLRAYIRGTAGCKGGFLVNFPDEGKGTEIEVASEYENLQDTFRGIPEAPA